MVDVALFIFDSQISRLLRCLGFQIFPGRQRQSSCTQEGAVLDGPSGHGKRYGVNSRKNRSPASEAVVKEYLICAFVD